MEAEEYHYDGEFSLDGVVFSIENAKEDIVHIRDHFQFLEDDIVVATYPKSGRALMADSHDIYVGCTWTILKHHHILSVFFFSCR